MNERGNDRLQFLSFSAIFYRVMISYSWDALVLVDFHIVCLHIDTMSPSSIAQVDPPESLVDLCCGNTAPTSADHNESHWVDNHEPMQTWDQ